MNVFQAAKTVSIVEIYKAYAPEECVRAMRPYGNVRCPFHGHDNKPSMALYKDSNHAYCFTCNKSLDQIKFVQEIKGFGTAYPAAKDICERFNLSYDKLAPGEGMSPVEYNEYKNYTAVYNYLAQVFQKFYFKRQTPFPQFFEARGLSEETIKEYQLGYCPVCFIRKSTGEVMSFKSILQAHFPDIPEYMLDSYNIYNRNGDCLFAGRYIFPIKDLRNNVVGFSGRAIDDSVAKYYNTPVTKFFDKGSLLYNYCKAKNYSSIFILEGYMDVLSAVQSGVPNAVASMGTAFTDKHLELLQSKDIYLCLDNDNAGHQSMYRLINKYHSNRIFKVIKFNFDNIKDMNDALQNDLNIKDILRERNSMYDIEFVIKYLLNELDLNNIYDVEKYYDETMSVLEGHSICAKNIFGKKIKRMLLGKRGGNNYE